jgi:serine/threonine protein kinase
VSYCINPKCPNRYNPDDCLSCQACGTPLLVKNRYRLIEPLRQLDDYSYTEIFLVEDGDSQKVLKVLKNPNSKRTEMFEREANILKKLSHPGIPKVDRDGFFTVDLDVRSQKLECLVMEKIEGENLEQWLQNQKKPISQELALNWLRELIEIIAKLHQNELFHRDIKLSNIMLRPNGQLVLIDFGSVRQVTGSYLVKIAGGGEVTGIVSPGYTPLEQINGKALPQSDFFALSRSLVYLLTGKHPVDLPEDPQTGELIWRDNAPQVSPWLADLIDDLMAPFPGQRPLNTQEILARLDKPKRRSRRQNWNWLAILNLCFLIVNLLAGGLWFSRWFQQKPPSTDLQTTNQKTQ